MVNVRMSPSPGLVARSTRIAPALVDAGWQDHFEEQVPITDGRIMPTMLGHRRSERRLRADYVLQRSAGLNLAVVDAVADDVARPFNRTLRNPDGQVREPRYHQAVAINPAVTAIRSGRPRTLLTMATGTGKTFVALQVV